MMENSSVNACVLTDGQLRLKETVSIISYYVMPPIFLVSGMFGHTLALVIFITESKLKPAYIYQSQVVITEMLTMLAAPLFYLSYRMWSGGNVNEGGVLWYQQNYSLMWFAAHLSPILLENCVFLSFLMSVAAALDRFHALAKPANYNSIVNKRLLPRLALGISVVLAIVLGLPDCFLNGLAYVDGRYQITLDMYNPIIAYVLVTEYTRSMIELLGTLLLVFFNITVLMVFRRHNRTIGLSQSSSSNQEEKRRRTERNLMLLTMSQSAFTFMPRIFNIVYELFLRYSPSFVSCYSKVVGPLLDMTNMLCLMGTFYFNIIASRPFRESVIRILTTCCIKLCRVSIEPSIVSTASRIQPVQQFHQ